MCREQQNFFNRFDEVIYRQRDDMIGLLLTLYWDRAVNSKSYLKRLPVKDHRFLFATNPKNEGFFLVWGSPVGLSVLNRETFKAIAGEAKAAGLTGRFHIYASFAPYIGAGIEFYKIPDKILDRVSQHDPIGKAHGLQ